MKIFQNTLGVTKITFGVLGASFLAKKNRVGKNSCPVYI